MEACPTCRAAVPAHNLALHGLRCSGVAKRGDVNPRSPAPLKRAADVVAGPGDGLMATSPIKRRAKDMPQGSRRAHNSSHAPPASDSAADVIEVSSDEEPENALPDASGGAGAVATFVALHGGEDADADTGFWLGAAAGDPELAALLFREHAGGGRGEGHSGTGILDLGLSLIVSLTFFHILTHSSTCLRHFSALYRPTHAA